MIENFSSTFFYWDQSEDMRKNSKTPFTFFFLNRDAVSDNKMLYKAFKILKWQILE